MTGCLSRTRLRLLRAGLIAFTRSARPSPLARGFGLRGSRAHLNRSLLALDAPVVASLRLTRLESGRPD